MANICDVMETAIKEAGKTIRLNKRFSEIMFVILIFSAMFCVFGYSVTHEVCASMKELTVAINDQSKSINLLIQRHVALGVR